MLKCILLYCVLLFPATEKNKFDLIWFWLDRFGSCSIMFRVRSGWDCNVMRMQVAYGDDPWSHRACRVSEDYRRWSWKSTSTQGHLGTYLQRWNKWGVSFVFVQLLFHRFPFSWAWELRVTASLRCSLSRGELAAFQSVNQSITFSVRCDINNNTATIKKVR